MADAQEIIRTILSDPRIATNSNFAGKLYRDEPILLTAPQLANYTPPRIREMRKLAKPFDPEAKIFYEQGRFMEDFEDEFDFRGAVVQYFPTYQALMDAQLRGYFSWRTRVRRGDVGRTSLSFAFLYIYELLNGIGTASPEEGFRTLRKFWEDYRAIDARIDSYATLWLKDYAVYHDLDRSLLDGLPDADFDRALAVLLARGRHGTDEVFAAMNSLSAYNLEESKFFLLRPEETKAAAVRVFDMVSKHYDRNPRNSAREKLFGRVVVNSYVMFKSAVFHRRGGRQADRVYEIGAGHRYIRRAGAWSCERFVGYGLNNRKIGAILKTVDCLLREKFGYRSTLQPGKTNKVLTAKIEKEIAAFFAERREAEARAVRIDVSKLGGIRADALATQERLLVGEEPEKAPAAAAEPPPPAPGGAPALDAVERGFLSLLLCGAEHKNFLRERGVMESVVVDSINGKCFDRFGDTVLAGGDGVPEIVDDYRGELKGMLAE